MLYFNDFEIVDGNIFLFMSFLFFDVIIIDFTFIYEKCQYTYSLNNYFIYDKCQYIYSLNN